MPRKRSFKKSVKRSVKKSVKRSVKKSVKLLYPTNNNIGLPIDKVRKVEHQDPTTMNGKVVQPKKKLGFRYAENYHSGKMLYYEKRMFKVQTDKYGVKRFYQMIYKLGNLHVKDAKRRKIYNHNGRNYRKYPVTHRFTAYFLEII